MLLEKLGALAILAGSKALLTLGYAAPAIALKLEAWLPRARDRAAGAKGASVSEPPRGLLTLETQFARLAAITEDAIARARDAAVQHSRAALILDELEPQVIAIRREVTPYMPPGRYRDF